MPLTDKDHRSQERLRVTGKVKLFWDENGAPQQAAAEIFDISPTGLSCWMPRRLPTGARVKIEAAHLKLFGFAMVRHSRGQGMRILVGMQFEGGLRWLAPGQEVAKPRWT